MVFGFVLFGLMSALGAAPVLAQDGAAAFAELRSGEGEVVGTAEFVETSEGVPPGTHGVHIHEKGDLPDPAFESAGDLENITVAEDGTAVYEYVNDRITLPAGPDSILNSDGSALILHKTTDDYRTDDDPETGPGMSWDRVAAGVIEAEEPMPATGGVSYAARRV